MSKRQLTWIVIGGLLAGSAYAGEIPPERQAALANMLRQDCGSCHGMTRHGGLGPSLLPEALAGKSDEFLIQTILNGRPATAMPPWRSLLTPDEAAWLVQQLRFQSTPLTGRIWMRLPLAQINFIPLKGEVSN